MQAEPLIDRLLISSGSIWEEKVGYSRAVRVGNMVFVAGTTATDPITGQVLFPDKVDEQTSYIFQKIESALHAAGASLKDVVRTRMFVTNISNWEDVAKIHGQIFKDIKPVTTMVQVQALIDPKMLIEIEAEAVVPNYN